MTDYFGGTHLELIDSNDMQYLQKLNRNIKKLSNHRHEGQDGLKLDGSSAFEASSMDASKIFKPQSLSIAKFVSGGASSDVQDNDLALNWRSSTNPALYLPGFKVNSSNKLEFLSDSETINLTNNTSLQADDSGGTPTSLIVYNSSDELTLSQDAYTASLLPQTTDTYDLFSSSVKGRSLYLSSTLQSKGMTFGSVGGTWTPVLSFDVISGNLIYQTNYLTQLGTYQRVGNLILVTFSIAISSIIKGSGTSGTAKLYIDLPFPSLTKSYFVVEGKLGDSNFTPRRTRHVVLNTNSSRMYIIIDRRFIDGTWTYDYLSSTINDSEFGGFQIKGTVLYETS